MSRVDSAYSLPSFRTLGLGRSPERPGNHRRILIGALVLALVATMSEQLVVPRPAAAAEQAAPVTTACPASRPDRAAASITARLCGSRVEVESMLTETTRGWVRPDGVIDVEQSLGQERFRDASGG